MRNPHAMVRPVSDYVSDPGSSIHIIREARFNGSTLEVVEVGQENIQDKIEAFAPFTDLNYMLHRLSIGDNSVVTTRQPLYGDFSEMPTNPVDAINLVHSAEDAFTRLSVDDRAKYNNDYRVWLAEVLTAGNVSHETKPEPETNPAPADGGEIE